MPEDLVGGGEAQRQARREDPPGVCDERGCGRTERREAADNNTAEVEGGTMIR